jgi:predicted RNA polymerase sigma factor
MSFADQHSLTWLPGAYALLPLFCFLASRLYARLDVKGPVILLKNQDRNKWSRSLIQKGFDYIEMAAEPFEVAA